MFGHLLLGITDVSLQSEDPVMRRLSVLATDARSLACSRDEHVARIGQPWCEWCGHAMSTVYDIVVDSSDAKSGVDGILARRHDERATWTAMVELAIFDLD